MTGARFLILWLRGEERIGVVEERSDEIRKAWKALFGC